MRVNPQPVSYISLWDRQEPIKLRCAKLTMKTCQSRFNNVARQNKNSLVHQPRVRDPLAEECTHHEKCENLYGTVPIQKASDGAIPSQRLFVVGIGRHNEAGDDAPCMSRNASDVPASTSSQALITLASRMHVRVSSQGKAGKDPISFIL